MAEEVVWPLRAFVIARASWRPQGDVLLLKALKKRRGFHEQLPGGRVDVSDFTTLSKRKPEVAKCARNYQQLGESGAETARNRASGGVSGPDSTGTTTTSSSTAAAAAAARTNNSSSTKSRAAAGSSSTSEHAAAAIFKREVCRIAAAREFHEETGIDLPLERLTHLANLSRHHREYFEVFLLPTDSVSRQQQSSSAVWTALEGPEGSTFALLLSKEHVGCRFESDLAAAAEAVASHSGGESRRALKDYYAAQQRPPDHARRRRLSGYMALGDYDDGGRNYEEPLLSGAGNRSQDGSCRSREKAAAAASASPWQRALAVPLAAWGHIAELVGRCLNPAFAPAAAPAD